MNINESYIHKYIINIHIYMYSREILWKSLFFIWKDKKTFSLSLNPTNKIDIFFKDECIELYKNHILNFNENFKNIYFSDILTSKI